MNVTIRVFRNAIAVQIGNGLVLWHYDWITVLAIIRDNDKLVVQDYTGIGTP